MQKVTNAVLLFLLAPVFLMAAPTLSENGFTQALNQAANQALYEQNTCSPDFSQPTVTFNSKTYPLLNAYQDYFGNWINRYLNKQIKMKKYGGNTILETYSNEDPDQIDHVKDLVRYARQRALDSFEKDISEEVYYNQIDKDNALVAYTIDKLDPKYGSYFAFIVVRVHRTFLMSENRWIINHYKYSQYMRTGVKNDTRADKDWQKARDVWHEFIYGDEGKNNSSAKALAADFGKIKLPEIIKHNYKCYLDFAND